MLQTLIQTCRSLFRHRGFTAIVILTLALGIGATTAIFSVVRHVLLSPLPYSEPERLARIWVKFPEVRSDSFPAAHQEYLDYRAENQLLEEIGAYGFGTAVLTEAGDPLRLTAALTTSSLWRVLGVEAELGRTYGEGEDQPGSEPLAVLSHGLWQRRFGGDPGIVGQTMLLDGVANTVLGVMPPSFRFPDPEVDVWLAYPLDPTRRNNHHLRMLGRMKHGVTLTQVEQEMEVLAGRWEQVHEHWHAFRAVSYSEEVLGPVRGPLTLLFVAVVSVLVIACFNVAGLLLARGESRQQELGVRAALGASRRQLLGRLLIESLILGLIGGALGVDFAHLGLKALAALEPGDLPRGEDVAIDSSVLLFALGLSLLVSLAFGLLPALKASRPRLTTVLSAAGARTTSPRQLLRRGLVVAETAAAVTLVAGAFLLLHSFWQLRQVDPGFDPGHVLTAQVSLPASDYPEAHDVNTFYRQTAERLAALPGVRSVSVSNSLYSRIRLVLVKGAWQSADDDWMGADVMMVSPDYFRTLGITRLAGRRFSDADGPEAPRVAVVNQALAATLFADRDPIGQHVRIEQARPREPTFEVVGLVADSRTFGLAEEVRPQIYFPLPQIVPQIRGVTRGLTLAVKTEVEPLALAPDLRSAVWAIDDKLAVSDLQTMTTVLSESLARERFLTTLLAVFGGLALVLAAVGIYALLAHVVGLRRRELGIRLALGAKPGELQRMVLSEALVLTGLGVALGLAGALASGRLIRGLLADAVATDWPSLVATPLLLIATGLLACALPAHRAATIDPAATLREE